MVVGASRRRATAPSRFEPEIERPPQRASRAYRLIHPDELAPDRIDDAIDVTLHVFWPEDEGQEGEEGATAASGTWYPARLVPDSFDPESGLGDVLYPETDEVEAGADVRGLATEGHLAVLVPRRPPGRPLAADEVAEHARYSGRALAARGDARPPGAPGLGHGGGGGGRAGLAGSRAEPASPTAGEGSDASSSEDSVPDAGALEDASDEDVDLEDELRSRQAWRKRGAVDDESGDDEVPDEAGDEDAARRREGGARIKRPRHGADDASTPRARRPKGPEMTKAALQARQAVAGAGRAAAPAASAPSTDTVRGKVRVGFGVEPVGPWPRRLEAGFPARAIARCIGALGSEC